jgi:hypothetical protein
MKQAVIHIASPVTALIAPHFPSSSAKAITANAGDEICHDGILRRARSEFPAVRKPAGVTPALFRSPSSAVC